MKKKLENIPRKKLVISLILMGVILLVSVVLLNSFSLPDNVETISFQSKSLDYENRESGSFGVTKSANWVGKEKIQITIDVDTVSLNNNQTKDVILVLDTSFPGRLRNLKQDVINLTNQVLKNKNSKIALITFNESSSIVSNLTNNKEEITSMINDLTSTSNRRNYYQALVNVNEILKDYQYQENKEINVLFITYGYPTINTPNEESYYSYLKNRYPYLKISGIQYEMGNNILSSIQKVSDNQYIADRENFGNTLFQATSFTKKYDRFILKDEINSDYLTISSIKTTSGTVEKLDNQITWDLSNLYTGEKAQLIINATLKGEYVNETGLISTIVEQEISYKIGSIEESFTNFNAPTIKDSYQVSYDGNEPIGCSITNVPLSKKYSAFDVVEIDNLVPICKGYQFKEWKIIPENVTKLNKDNFIMPESDVVLKAEWSKVTLAKSTDGEIYEGDPDLPKDPVVKVYAEYPMITAYDVELAVEFEIEFDDTRDDIENYYSVDGGETWILYEGPVVAISKDKNIMAKVKNPSTDAEIVVSKNIQAEMAEDALDINAYDEDDDTFATIYPDKTKLYVDSSVYNEDIALIFNNTSGCGYNQESCTPMTAISYFEFVMKDKTTKIETIPYTNNEIEKTLIKVPEGALYINIYNNGVKRSELYEVYPYSQPIITETLHYPTILEYGVETHTKVIINYFKTSEQRLYRINGGEWINYQDKEIQLELTDVLEAKGIDKNGKETRISKYTVSLDGILNTNVYDGNLDTYDGYTNDSKVIYIDKSMYGKNVRIVADVTSGYWDREQTTIAIYDKEKNIMETTTFNNGDNNYNDLIYDKEWNIPDGAFYIQITAHNYEAKIYEILPDIINEKKYYATITEYGIDSNHNGVTINYPKDFIKRLYRINSGEWQEYQDKEIRLEIGDKLEAKGINQNNKETNVSYYTAVLLEDTLGIEAYDNNEETYAVSSLKSVNEYYKYINIDKTMWENKISLKYTAGCWSSIYMVFYDENNESLGRIEIEPDACPSDDRSSVKQIEVPANAVKIELTGRSYYASHPVQFYEIYPETAPIINEIKHYPTITEYGVTPGYNEATIKYFKTSEQRLYRINEGEWQNYQDQPIRLEIGDIIEAKGMDKNGVETNTSSHTTILRDDTLEPEAYDGNYENWMELSYNTDTNENEYYLAVDDTMQGNKFRLYFYVSLYNKIEINCYDENDNKLSTESYTQGGNSGKDITNEYLIAAGTKKVGIYIQSDNKRETDIYELEIDNTPIIGEKKYYPTLTKDGIKSPYNEVTINYFSTSEQRLYRINEGEWQNYQDQPIRLEIGDIIEAKGIDKNGVATKVSNYTSFLITDALGIDAYDQNMDTSDLLSTTSKYIDISESLNDYKIKMNYSGISGYWLKYNFELEDGKITETEQVKVNTEESIISIPENAKRLVLTASSNNRVYLDEISIFGSRQSVHNPTIKTNDTEVTADKSISITYPEEYTKEYSLDLGETWNLFTETITLKEPTTVFARSVDENGKVVSSSSFKVTTIEESIKLSEAIFRDNELIDKEPTLTTSGDSVSDPSGLYTSTDTNDGRPTYYFRGDVTNNYVSFIDQTWKIIRVNEDGTIRLIMQEGIDNNNIYQFNTTNANAITTNEENKNRMYYSNNSNARTLLNNWYITNITNKGYNSYVSTGDYFCEQAKVAYQSNLIANSGANMVLYSSYTPNFKCSKDSNGKGIVNANVGLITYDELLFSKKYNAYSVDSTTTDFWTMSPAGAYFSGASSMHNSAYIWGWNTSKILRFDVKIVRIIRPVINLKTDTLVKGTGTNTDPYVVQ